METNRHDHTPTACGIVRARERCIRVCPRTMGNRISGGGAGTTQAVELLFWSSSAWKFASATYLNHSTLGSFDDRGSPPT